MLRITATFLVVVFGTLGTAEAQGKGGGVGKGRQTAGAPVRSNGQTSNTSVALQTLPSFPQFGTWLDDASIATAGAGYASVGTTYWRGSSANQIDVPVLGVTYGIAKHLHVSATIPFYRVSYEGFSGSGLDNVYVASKLALVNPEAADRGFGLAIGAVAEILSASIADASRVHWAVPLSVEFRKDVVRVYGSTSYFSRGAISVAGALEWTVPTGTSFTASLAHSASVDGVTLATTGTAPNGTLNEASLFVSHPVSAGASMYVGGSRTFSRTEISGATSVGVGLSFRFAGP